MPPSVLVVEDDRANGLLFEQALKLHAYPVKLLQDGASTLAYLEQNQIQILIINAGLPGGMSGYDIIRELIKKSIILDMRVMVISARAIHIPPDLTNFVHSSLQKPFSIEQLLRELEQLSAPFA